MKKRIGYSILFVILVVTLGFGLSPAQAYTGASLPAHLRGQEPAYVPGQLVVGFLPSATQGPVVSQASGLAQGVGGRILSMADNGTALLAVDQGTNLRSLALRIKGMKGVRFAEPNYLFQTAQVAASSAIKPPTDYVIRQTHGRNASETIKMAYPVAGLQAMKSKVGSALMATYPSDPFLWWNAGWQWVGADIVSSNSTASKNVCVIDSGVDYNHKDLAGKVLKGHDFVNNDGDPMDDYGQGTHVAGIIAAASNNGIGIAGVSTGKVLAVKVIDASGMGTAFDIGQAIYYCANRSDVSILNLSLFGPDTFSVYSAVDYAFVKGKLVVAAAGDSGNFDKLYPAGYAQDATVGSGVVAVAAGGNSSGMGIDYNCKASYSNYGDWITLVAPGTAIYSTTPYDRPFTLHDFGSTKERYDYMDSTAMAAAFVSATAARAWGYQATLTAVKVKQRLVDSGWPVSTDSGCWDSSTSAARQVNVASALGRAGVSLAARDAATNLPLTGATVGVYNTAGTTLLGSSLITPTSPIDPTTGLVNMQFTSWADVINLPVTSATGTKFVPKISLANYTTSPQRAFAGNTAWGYANGSFDGFPGVWSNAGWASVPPKSANFTVVGATTDTVPFTVLWLPVANPYIVNPSYTIASLGDADVVPYGSLNEHPYARWLIGDFNFQSIAIQTSPAHKTAPYYSDDYWVGMTDGRDPGKTNHLDNGWVSAFVWKDGIVQVRVDKGSLTCGVDKHWWYPLRIMSLTTGAVNYPSTSTATACGVRGDMAY